MGISMFFNRGSMIPQRRGIAVNARQGHVCNVWFFFSTGTNSQIGWYGYFSGSELRITSDSVDKRELPGCSRGSSVARDRPQATGYKPCGTCQTTGLSPRLVKLYARSLPAWSLAWEPLTPSAEDVSIFPFGKSSPWGIDRSFSIFLGGFLMFS